jgi:DNA-binding response OmpR family regulator
MKTLLASSSPAARRIVRGLLERAGIKQVDVFESGDGKETYAAFKSSAGAPSFAVIDWDMPELDAPALARYLRASFGGKVGVLFCIKSSDRVAVAEISGLGPFDWIERPFADQAFLEKIRIFRQAAEKAKADDSASHLRAIASGKNTELALPFLLQVPSHLIDDLLKKAVRSRHAPGTVLLRPDDVPEALHLVTRGQVEILEETAGIRSRV